MRLYCWVVAEEPEHCQDFQYFEDEDDDIMIGDDSDSGSQQPQFQFGMNSDCPYNPAFNQIGDVVQIAIMRIPADLASNSSNSMTSSGDNSLSAFEDIANTTLTLSGVSGNPLTLSAANLVINGQVVDVKPGSGNNQASFVNRSRNQNSAHNSGHKPFLDTGDCYIDDELTSLSWLRDRNILQNTTPLDAVAVEAALRDVATFPPPPPTVPRRRGLPKPPFSFSTLIFMAIEQSAEKRLPVKDIYAWILNNFPYFRFAPSGWRNSVRHNLSLNRCFMKIQKDNGMFNSKGSLWCVDPVFRPNLLHALKRVTAQPYGHYPHYSGASPVPGDESTLRSGSGLGNDEITDVDVANALMEMKAAAPRAHNEGQPRSRLRRWALKQTPEDHTYSAEDQGAEPIVSSGETEEENEDSDIESSEEEPKKPARRPRKNDENTVRGGRGRGRGAGSKRGRPVSTATKAKKEPAPKRGRKGVPRKSIPLPDAENDEEEGSFQEEDDRALALLEDADEDDAGSGSEESEVDVPGGGDSSESDLDEGADAEMAQVLMRWREKKNAATVGQIDSHRVKDEEGEDDSDLEGRPLEIDESEALSKNVSEFESSSVPVPDSGRSSSHARKGARRPQRISKAQKVQMEETIAAARARPEPEVIRPSVGVMRTTSTGRSNSVQTRSRQTKTSAKAELGLSPSTSTSGNGQMSRLDELIAMFKSNNSESSEVAADKDSPPPMGQRKALSRGAAQKTPPVATGSSRRKKKL